MAKTNELPVSSLRFNISMIIKLWTTVNRILDGEKTSKAVSKQLGNIASARVIGALTKYLKELDRPQLESLRDRLKDVNSIKEVEMGELCARCKKKIVGAAQLTARGFEHIICPEEPLVPDKEKETEEENDMGKTTKKKAGKGKKAVEKKAAKKPEAAKKETKSKNDKPKISAVVYDCIKAKMTYEQTEKAVRKVHPESKFNEKHFSWYKNQYEKIKK